MARQSEFEEAQQLLIESYEGIKKLEASRPIFARNLLRETLQRFVDLYAAWDKPEEAAKWQSKLDEHVEASK